MKSVTTYRVPILETVVQASSGLRIVPEAPDGSYTILGTRLSLRVQADTNLKISIDGAQLPRRESATSTSGWFEPTGSVPKSGSRKLFWDVGIELPAAVLMPEKKNFPVTVAYDTFSNVWQPSLQIKLRLAGRDPDYTKVLPAPSGVFIDNTENTKEDNRMESAIVARGVTVAGWLFDPHRNDGPTPLPMASEDWHYDIYLDPDFIERNYSSPVVVEPLRSAVLPGNVVPLSAGPATPIPLLSANSALPTSKPTAAALTMPGNGILTVELNAWHTWARGARPNGWDADPNNSYGNNAWPFNPLKGTANEGGSDLKAGDYVILSGTLWQDTSHGGDQDTTERSRKCFNERFKGHGGWLELHPVDAVRRVDAPSPRKHVVGMSACYPLRPNFDTQLRHPEAPPSTSARLRFEVIVDDRFTSPNAVHAEQVNTACEPPLLRVTANVLGTGSYNATYTMWWEEGAEPRPSGGATCIPAISPILGGAAD
jgi:hypothetical protein